MRDLSLLPMYLFIVCFPICGNSSLKVCQLFEGRIYSVCSLYIPNNLHNVLGYRVHTQCISPFFITVKSYLRQENFIKERG
jgi:hypothetical protein